MYLTRELTLGKQSWDLFGFLHSYFKSSSESTVSKDAEIELGKYVFALKQVSYNDNFSINWSE